MKMKRLCAAFVAALLLLTVFACSDPTKPPSGETSETGSQSSGDDTSSPVQDGKYKTNIPVNDLGGRKFTFFYANWYNDNSDPYDLFAEEFSEDPINDAVYNRQLWIEENLKCSVEAVHQFSSETACEMLIALYMSNDQDFGMILRVNKFLSLASEGYLYNLADLPNCDYEQPYWDSNSYDTLSILGYHFGVCGDFELRDKDATELLVYNKQILEDVGITDSLYELVDNKQWTLDKLAEYAKKGSKDLNGDSTWDISDRYGLGIWADSLFSFLSGGGLHVADKSSDDLPVFKLGDADVVDYSHKIMDFIYDTSTVINAHVAGNGDAGGVLEGMFQNDQLLFMWQKACDVPVLRHTDIEYGLLPMPMASDTQKEYHNNVNAWQCSCLILPANLSEEEAYYFSAFLEEFSCQGRNMIYPRYYEIMLKEKVAQDPESQKIIDLIFDSRDLDIGVVFNWSDVAYRYCSLTRTYDTGVAALYDGYKTLVEKEIERLATFVNNKYSK